jgi:hypothetical protein
MIALHRTDKDDPHFVDIVGHLLNEMVKQHQPEEFYIVLIDNWFDHKWLNFSGTVMHEIAVWKSKTTLPPFHPFRVLNQLHFRLSEREPLLYEAAPCKPLHIHQPSAENLQRALRQVTSSGLMLWYSGATQKTDRASTMVYIVEGQQEGAWYACFRKVKEWKLEKTKGIARTELLEILKRSGGPGGV